MTYVVCTLSRDNARRQWLALRRLGVERVSVERRGRMTRVVYAISPEVTLGASNSPRERGSNEQ